MIRLMTMKLMRLVVMKAGELYAGTLRNDQNGRKTSELNASTLENS